MKHAVPEPVYHVALQVLMGDTVPDDASDMLKNYAKLLDAKQAALCVMELAASYGVARECIN